MTPWRPRPTEMPSASASITVTRNTKPLALTALAAPAPGKQPLATAAAPGDAPGGAWAALGVWAAARQTRRVIELRARRVAVGWHEEGAREMSEWRAELVEARDRQQERTAAVARTVEGAESKARESVQALKDELAAAQTALQASSQASSQAQQKELRYRA